MTEMQYVLTFRLLQRKEEKNLRCDLRKHAEEAKVAIRSIRRDAIDTYKTSKKNGEITEDDLKDIEKDIQNLTDEYVKEIDSMTDKKEKEIMSV